MDVSVVVLTYDSARTIEACLRSLAAQTVPPAEVLVVDDDSTDATLDLVARFARTAPVPVRVLRNGSHNISRGRNVGVAAAAGPVVAFIDSDARAAPGWIAGLVKAFDAETGPAVVGGGVDTAHATAFARAVAINDGLVRDVAASGALLVSGCNLAVHKGRTGGLRFDERWVHAEDIEYVDRVGRFAVAADARVEHESRATPRGYFRQMYRYGLWKVRYTIRTGNVRLVDYTPTAVLLAALLAAAVTPWALLVYPTLSVAETAVVAAWRRPAPSLLPLMLVGWLVKNTGWGLGVLVALAQQAVGRSGVPATPEPVG